ncbi:hypothetical protein LPC08_17840 [Roseomonas sp. OT10]|uniref:hypothetical protein n=1 Tax=Roseomonas cutis TaxID=2897332 RepID=UPI001E64074E|nr:hypothetical protein [Roseomonas sp. OT10]UFN47861.1 hypothetical protein LPC08_17840 [Roseomonas sp. OT10]
MFVYTADENYLLARLAFINRLPLDFLWLSLHAIEKYYKAILLFNGRSTKKFGHDLVKLRETLRSIDHRILLEKFDAPPKNFNSWNSKYEHVDTYIKQLSSYGSAGNRYMMYGYHVYIDDLIRVDQMVCSARRWCLPLTENLSGKDPFSGECVETILDNGSFLEANPGYRPPLGGPLERIIGGLRGPEAKSALLFGNTVLKENAYVELRMIWWLSSSDPPLADVFDLLENPLGGGEDKEEARLDLEWFLDNVKTSLNEEKFIREFISKCGKNTNIG